MIHNDLGRPAQARELLEALLEDALRNDELQTTIPFLTQLARACALQGQPEAGRPSVEGMLARMDAIPFFDGSCGPALVEICYWLEQAEGASAAARGESCLERLRKYAQQVRPVDAGPMLAEAGAVVASMRQETEGALALFSEAAAGWSALRRPYPKARSLLGRGRALASLERGDEAKAAFRDAQQLLEDLRAKLPDAAMRESFTRGGLLALLQASLTDLG